MPMPMAGVDEQTARIVRIVYRNWRGETAERHIIPLRSYEGETEFHKGRQLLLEAIDMPRGVVRTFAEDGIIKRLAPGEIWEG